MKKEERWSCRCLTVIGNVLREHLYAAPDRAGCISFPSHPYDTLDLLLLVLPSGSFTVAKLYFAAQMDCFH